MLCLCCRAAAPRTGPPLHLPGEVQCLDLWQVLQGLVLQQRVWTFGLQTPAALQAPPAADAETVSEQQPAGTTASAPVANPTLTPPAATAATPNTPDAIESLVQPCTTSSEPQSVKHGVRFTCCSAGHQHSAAAAEGGYVYTWGSNNWGQLGCDTCTEQPVAIHVLSTPPSTAADPAKSGGHTGGSSSSTAPKAGTVSSKSCGAVSQGSSAGAAAATRAMLSKLDSLKLLGSTVNLPPSLMAGLQQERQRKLQAAQELQEQQQLLLQDILQHPELGQQPQLAGKPVAPQPGAAKAAAHAAVLSGISSSSSAAIQLPHNQQQDARPQALAVYRLHLGQAVRCIACGAHHTLAALASSGLVSASQTPATSHAGSEHCRYQICAASASSHPAPILSHTRAVARSSVHAVTFKNAHVMQCLCIGCRHCLALPPVTRALICVCVHICVCCAVRECRWHGASTIRVSWAAARTGCRQPAIPCGSMGLMGSALPASAQAPSTVQPCRRAV